jgi:hypothetical protein
VDRKIYVIEMTALKRAVEHLQTLDLPGMLECAHVIGSLDDVKMIDLACHLIAELPDSLRHRPPL